MNFYKGRLIALKSDIETTCPEGREDNYTALVDHVDKDGKVVFKNDLRGSNKWDQADLIDVEEYPYYECSQTTWELYTVGMTIRGKHQLANMLAHHCLLARRDVKGWILTRFDLITNKTRKSPFWHVSNDGELSYDYIPKMKE